MIWKVPTEIGFCNGIENYSRVIQGRAPGTPPTTLLDYFPDDFLMFVDESHVTLPQCRAMYAGDRSRKDALVNYGFRLPSAYDNRPLNFHEFDEKINQVIYVSATPGEYERTRSGQIVEQVIRPTGLLDPVVEVRPIEGQIDDLIGEINERTARQERVLVTTLTKKMAEDLTTYLAKGGDQGAICTRRWPPWSGWRSSGICVWQNSMYWWASICCGRAWIFRRSVWWPFWMQIRRASFARKPA